VGPANFNDGVMNMGLVGLPDMFTFFAMAGAQVPGQMAVAAAVPAVVVMADAMGVVDEAVGDQVVVIDAVLAVEGAAVEGVAVAGVEVLEVAVAVADQVVADLAADQADVRRFVRLQAEVAAARVKREVADALVAELSAQLAVSHQAVVALELRRDVLVARVAAADQAEASHQAVVALELRREVLVEYEQAVADQAEVERRWRAGER
jgi:hypothetical protein